MLNKTQNDNNVLKQDLDEFNNRIYINYVTYQPSLTLLNFKITSARSNSVSHHHYNNTKEK